MAPATIAVITPAVITPVRQKTTGTDIASMLATTITSLKNVFSMAAGRANFPGRLRNLFYLVLAFPGVFLGVKTFVA